MSGQLWQWVEDEYQGNLKSKPKNGKAWSTGKTSEVRRVLRGGSWFSYPVFLRSTSRDWGSSSFRSNYIGFRVVRRPTP